MKKEQSYEENIVPARPKWTDSKRRELYVGLLKNFGQWSTWQTKASPYKAKDVRKQIFTNYLESFDNLFDVTAAAQLAWMYHVSDIGMTEKGKPQKYNHRNMMRNKLAAFDTGFAGEEIFSNELNQVWPAKPVEKSGRGLHIFNLLFEDDEEWDDFDAFPV